MGRPRILDRKIMTKLAKKLGKRDLHAVNSMVSARASKKGISSESALVLLAKEYGIGTSTYQRKLDPTKQAEIRDGLVGFLAATPKRDTRAAKPAKAYASRRSTTGKAQLRAAIEYLIEDDELRNRCTDILIAPRNFDRPINQATLVLEDRIRKKAAPSKKLVGENLVGYAYSEELARTVLEVPGADADDQRGFTQMLRGIVPAFRNKTHHHIVTSFSRNEAMRVCGFIDVLLRVVDGSTKLR
jgi:Protein of unknown function (Hypoth_ymh)